MPSSLSCPFFLFADASFYTEDFNNWLLSKCRKVSVILLVKGRTRSQRVVICALVWGGCGLTHLQAAPFSCLGTEIAGQGSGKSCVAFLCVERKMVFSTSIKAEKSTAVRKKPSFELLLFLEGFYHCPQSTPCCYKLLWFSVNSCSIGGVSSRRCGEQLLSITRSRNGTVSMGLCSSHWSGNVVQLVGSKNSAFILLKHKRILITKTLLGFYLFNFFFPYRAHFCGVFILSGGCPLFAARCGYRKAWRWFQSLLGLAQS